MPTRTPFPQPSLLSGIARLFDFWGLYDTDTEHSLPRDEVSLYSDWRAVGEDLWTAMDRFAADQQLPAPSKLSRAKNAG
ncbi:MAG: hypothetical protein GY854_01475 [Deltaproteobacteria bacterium]|nr:hypothetical protein [Deltaproteobacteria bacterium]